MSGIMCLDFDIKRLTKPFTYTLVDKFSFLHPCMDNIHAFFHNLNLIGVFTMGLLDAFHVLIKLSNNLDYSRVFPRHSYYILNYQMCKVRCTCKVGDGCTIKFANKKIITINLDT